MIPRIVFTLSLLVFAFAIVSGSRPAPNQQHLDLPPVSPERLQPSPSFAYDGQGGVAREDEEDDGEEEEGDVQRFQQINAPFMEDKATEQDKAAERQFRIKKQQILKRQENERQQELKAVELASAKARQERQAREALEKCRIDGSRCVCIGLFVLYTLVVRNASTRMLASELACTNLDSQSSHSLPPFS
jgi:hypothetical protein